MQECGLDRLDRGLADRYSVARPNLRQFRSRCAIHNYHRANAFTLIELILVLAVLALLMAAAAPNLRGWGKGGKMRDATDQVLTAARFAQSQAIYEAVVYRLAVNPVDGALEVWRIDGQSVTPAAGDFYDPVELPQGFALRIQRFDGTVNPVVEFYPDGRVSPASIELTAPWGERTIIESRWPAQPFRLVPEGGMP